MKNNDSEKIPLDAKLLSYAIIELNISRRNVAIYPRDHPSVETSLSNAFKFLKQLFKIRSHITLAVAKDIIIIDKYHLDKKNPVFRDFALTLSRMNIAYITLKNGVTKDELYRFHRFITEKTEDFTVDSLRQVAGKYNIHHMDIGFVDYRKFATGDFKSVKQTQSVPLWERYIYGLLEGTLEEEEVPSEVREIPPEVLASLLNKVSDRPFKEEAYEKVITTYMRNSSESIFSGQDLKRLLDFIDGLRPDLKNRFLSSAVKTFSEDTASTYQALKKMPVEEIEEFLETVNRQRITIPPALKSLIDKFSYNGEDTSDAIYLEEDLIEDEELLPSTLTDLFNEDSTDENSQATAVGTSLEEIAHLAEFDAADLKTSQLVEFDNEFNEDILEKQFNHIILELMSSETPSEADYQLFADILRSQSQQLLWIGQYEQLLAAFKVLESNKRMNNFPDISSKTLQHFHSPEFMLPLIDSFKLLGRQRRNEVWMVCDYYGKEIIPYLLDALIEEESQIIRRFIMDLLRQFGDMVIPATVKRLDDSRWFVKRNMLYILRDLDVHEVCEYIRPCCRDENPKVSLTALKCLLNAKDTYAIETVRGHLASESEELFHQALTLLGSFKIRESVDDLIGLLNKQEMTGADILKKIPIVRALGDIADPRAVDTLRVLLSKKSIIFRKMMDQLKEEIYRTLKNYPSELIKDLLEAGVESRNEVIREESSLLLGGIKNKWNT
jgi:HEAT repeat protein